MPAPGADRIPATGLKGSEGSPYLPDAALLAAANVALTLEMPLLLTGEPGCGKTEFAYAVASWLHPALPPLECHVHSDSRARDLLYRYDAERRFGDAQHGGERGRSRAGDARNYIELRGLGLAMMAERQRVVLIDEIDKAPRDLPNDLLRELDRWSFEIPELSDLPEGAAPPGGVPLAREMRPVKGARRPFVVITSNVERQLPDPFLRRCAFFHIRFPGVARLREILRSRFPDLEDLHVDRIVRVFLGLREVRDITKKPATSEMLNWTAALKQVYGLDAALPAVNAAYDRLTVKEGRVQPLSGAVPWTDLPALSCLIKLSSDMDVLQAASH